MWKVRRRAIVPSLHRKYIENMVGMFADSALHGVSSLQLAHQVVYPSPFNPSDCLACMCATLKGAPSQVDSFCMGRAPASADSSAGCCQDVAPRCAHDPSPDACGAGVSSAPAVHAWRREPFAKACVQTQAGTSVEMENFFSRLTLDIIGKAVFNYDFDSLTHDDPVIQVGPACS